MRIWPFIVLASCLVAPALARAGDPFAEFRLPSVTWNRGVAGTSLNSSGVTQSGGDAEGRLRDWQGRGSVSLSRGWDSDASSWMVQASGIADLAGGSSTERQDWSDATSRSDQVDKGSDELWLFSASLRTYPWTTPVGIALTAYGTGEHQQTWQRSDGRVDYAGSAYEQRDRQMGSRHTSTYAAWLSASVGLGRVRDATVVMDVHVLEQRLIETGAISGPLPPATREKLAAVLVVAGDYGLVHERPDRYVWRDVERVLRDAGALGEHGLDPYSLLRAREPYAFSMTRRVGWFAAPTIWAIDQSEHERTDSESWASASVADSLVVSEHATSSSRRVLGSDDAWLGGQAEFHRPLGWAWQFDAAATAREPIRPGDHGLYVSGDAQATWAVADRWGAGGSVTMARQYFSERGSDGVNSTDAWQIRYGIGLGYFLEDHTTLTLQLSEVQAANNASTEGRYYQRQGEISLGITYRFWRHLDAPGLIEPMHAIGRAS